MSLSILRAQLHTSELGEKTVADKACILSLIGILIRYYSELNQLGISRIVQPEQVSARLLQSRRILAHCSRGNTGQQLSRTVTQALVQVGMNLAGIRTPLTRELLLGIVPGKFVQHIVGRFVGSIIIGMGDIGYGNRLAAVVPAYPVGIRQIDADRG